MPRGVYDRKKMKKPKGKKRAKRAQESAPEFAEVAIRPKRLYKMRVSAPSLSAIETAELQKLVRDLEAENHRLEQLVVKMAEKLL